MPATATGAQVLDAVQAGTVEMGNTAMYYYWGKDPAMTFGTALPFGLNARQMNSWLRFGGGHDLLNDLLKNYNCFGVAAGNTGAQMGGWFRKEVTTLDDLKGLKFRIGGLPARSSPSPSRAEQLVPATSTSGEGSLTRRMGRRTAESQFQGATEDTTLVGRRGQAPQAAAMEGVKCIQAAKSRRIRTNTMAWQLRAAVVTPGQSRLGEQLSVELAVDQVGDRHDRAMTTEKRAMARVTSGVIRPQ